MAAKKAAVRPSASVEGYIAALPPSSRDVATSLRRTIHDAVPALSEAIKYGMPAFLLEGEPLLYFAVWKKHVGMYPLYRGDAELEARVGRYRDGKDTLRFLLSEPIPYDVVAHVARYKAASRRAGST